MAFDYSKSKSYQKIVSKAKSYSSKGKSSLKAQQQRMKERRSIFSTILKDVGVKKIRELNDVYDKNASSKAVKWMQENRASANDLRIAMEKSGIQKNIKTNPFVQYEAIMAGLKKDNEIDMQKAYDAELKKQKAITRKREMNNYGRELYAKRK